MGNAFGSSQEVDADILEPKRNHSSLKQSNSSGKVYLNKNNSANNSNSTHHSTSSFDENNVSHVTKWDLEKPMPDISFDLSLMSVNRDQLKILQELGAGASGSVYKVEFENEIYALKLYTTHGILSSHGEGNFLAFEREIYMIGSLRHKNIVSFVGIVNEPRSLGVLMEYCENGTLADYLQAKKPDFEQKVKLLLDISKALRYIHNKNVIHRDLKLENVLIDSYGIPKLADFGVSRLVQDSNNQNVTKYVGSGYFMAPEVTLGQQYSKSVDVFSFGILMYCVLFETLKPYGDSASMNVEVSVARDPTFRPKIPSSFKVEEPKYIAYIELMKQCWQHDADARPTFDEIITLLMDTEKLAVLVQSTTPLDEISYTVPDRIQKGPSIVVEQPIQKNQLQDHCLVEGNSLIDIIFRKSQNPICKVGGIPFSNDKTKYNNFFFFPNIIFNNRSEKPISVTDIQISYFDERNLNWKSVEEVTLASKYDDERTGQLVDVFPSLVAALQANQQNVYSLGVRIEVFGYTPLANRHRSHYSLPNPLKFQIQITDSDYCTKTMFIYFINPVPRMVQASLQGYKENAFYHTITCDDCRTSTRYGLLFTRKQGSSNVEITYLDSSPGSSTVTLQKQILEKLSYEAADKGLDKIEWQTSFTIKGSEEDVELHIYFLVDVKRYRCYGILVHIKTITTEVEEGMLLSSIFATDEKFMSPTISSLLQAELTKSEEAEQVEDEEIEQVEESNLIIEYEYKWIFSDNQLKANDKPYHKFLWENDCLKNIVTSKLENPFWTVEASFLNNQFCVTNEHGLLIDYQYDKEAGLFKAVNGLCLQSMEVIYYDSSTHCLFTQNSESVKEHVFHFPSTEVPLGVLLFIYLCNSVEIKLKQQAMEMAQKKKQAQLEKIGKVFGKIQVVDVFPDFTVKIVDNQVMADLRVQTVQMLPNSPGKWQMVSSFPNFKIKFVTHNPDFTICYVNMNPGVNTHKFK